MINENHILENLKEFSFPRLSGTSSERKSFVLAKKKIESLNLIPTVQEFSFSIFYSRFYPKISLGLLFWLHFILFLNIQIIFTYTNILLVVFLLTILIIITRKPEEIKIGKKLHSQNIFVKIPPNTEQKTIKNEEKNSRLYWNKDILLFSHLDSKGQSFSVKLRILLYYLWIFSFIIGLLINITNSYYIHHSIIFLQIFGILVLIINGLSTIFININRTNNNSKGAIDNASGISIVMELLNFYSSSKNRLKNINLWFVFTGAEESGTMGIRNFYKKIKHFDRNRTFIINFDSIARKVILYNHGLINNKNFKSNNFILENKDIMNLEKAKRIYIGTYSDGLFLLSKKFKGLGNGDKTSYNSIHSIYDDIDKIDPLVIKKLCQFYTILLDEIDSSIKY
ncbi:MAG: M28 family peptidase [Promethearchaeota archaeon]